jgi:uncharacterized membrane protein YqjE
MSWTSPKEEFRAAGAHTDRDTTRLTLLEIIRLLSAAGGAIFIQLGLHGDLVRAEWALEKSRLSRMLFLTLIGFSCGLCILLFTGALVLTCSWETPFRLHGILSVLAVYGLGLAIAWNRFHALSSLSNQAFTASREEILADIALIKSKF